ncbi:hypothetical protein [Deinococcus arcticus]|uniref:FlgD Ig-like domain-containing protein n=1 Tax=Deinococcus arcticus TaxID=2136176 RepID=A0A2T3WCQ7_9DEIO|nr:hypothetical protein [Deinococcus arcticus]PTA69690.1 hypothetical protein C8263_01340 [Deinococcus arcticus]
MRALRFGIAAPLLLLLALGPGASAQRFTLQGPPSPLYLEDTGQVTLKAVLANTGPRPVTLICLSPGAPILRGNLGTAAGGAGQTRLLPQGAAPTCARTGQVLTVPPGARYEYHRRVPLRRAGQGEYRVGWNVRPASGRAWLVTNRAWVVVSPGRAPRPTPTPGAYRAALQDSRAGVDSVSMVGARLRVTVVDELSRAAFLRALGRRNLDPAALDLTVLPPVTFGTRAWPHHAALTVRRQGEGYLLTLTVTNRAAQPLTGMTGICHPLAVTAPGSGVRVWQDGHRPCADLGVAVNLRPGAAYTQSFVWNGRTSLGERVPAGRYRVTAGWFGFSASAVLAVP